MDDKSGSQLRMRSDTMALQGIIMPPYVWLLSTTMSNVIDPETEQVVAIDPEWLEMIEYLRLRELAESYFRDHPNIQKLFNTMGHFMPDNVADRTTYLK
jgi:hypothetical protein